MSILTDRELEFLAGLNSSWSRLYWNELALLLTVQPGDIVGACLPLPLAGEVDALGSAIARRSAAGGGNLSANSSIRGESPTPALARKRGRGSAAAQAVTASSSLE
jgi:hypothetical protein